MEDGQSDICRVCRSEAAPDKPLFHPCVCTGSIRYIHQDCLVQWLKYSRKEYCELCKYRFSFTPIYSPDMPKRLPIKDIISGLLKSIGRAVRYWFHYTLVAFAWLGVVPLTACRIYRCLFTGSVSSLLTLPLDMLSTVLAGAYVPSPDAAGPTAAAAAAVAAAQSQPPRSHVTSVQNYEWENILADCFQGCFVVTCTLCAFISLVWLREQILHGGGPEWLDGENQLLNQQPANNAGNNGAQGAAAGGAANQNAGENAGEVEDAEEDDGNDMVGNVANNAAQDDNWNPIEWDRAAEELTWERLLGLDGSLVFLEHVFWVVSLNTLFILVFAFCPYHIGHFTIVGLKMEHLTVASQFGGLMTTLAGYIVIALSLVFLHALAYIIRFSKSMRILGLCYVVVKVALLVVVEIGIFPLICGWWLDICSLTMFDATLKDRENSFKLAPGTSMFIHWLVGMVYVFYFASFILLLREVLRPGVLWFLRNLNDPDFNPIQEMIHLPIYRHMRRFLASMVIFGSTVMLMLWLPVRVIKLVLPGFLPYNVMLSSDAPVSELSLELLLLQVVLPALLEQGHTRTWLKGLVKGWTVGMAWLLKLRSYLLGDEPLAEGDHIIRYADDHPTHQAPAAGVGAAGEGEAPPAGAPQNNNPAPAAAAAPVAGGLGAAHQAMLQGGGPTGFQPYKRPQLFHFRLSLLFAMMCVTLFFASLVSLIVPVFIGRRIMSVWMGDAKIHELYTAACGLYVCWVSLRAGTVIYNWVPQGYSAIINKVKEWVILAVKSLVIAALLIGMVPLLLGLLFELVVVAPLRVPLDQSPVFFPWQDWALGVLHAKIICAITMMGPQWWLRRNIEQVYNQGLRNMNLSFILCEICAPVIGCLGMALALPYVIAKSIVPVLGFDLQTQIFVLRRIYPFLLSLVILISVCLFQARQFKRLYEHIKNDKYLVGQRLVNYERRTPQTTPARETSTPT